MELIKKKEQEEIFWKHWDTLVLRTSAGPRYMQSAIRNFIEMSESRELLKVDESAVVIQNNEPVGAVFLPIEEKDGVRSISFSGRHTMAPLFTSDFARKELMGYIDKVARTQNVAKTMFVIDPLLKASYPYNFLLAHDYLDDSFLTYLIDLTLPGDLLRHSRRGHRSDIKTVLKNPDYVRFVVDKMHSDYDLHEEYRELHRIDAGRVTRSKDSFDSQYKKLTDGNAILCGVRYKGKVIAYAYYEMYEDKAVYASAAADPEMTHLPLYHILMWSAMEYFQNKGVKWIDVGQPANPSAQFGYITDDKIKNIARFKRGFGGTFVDESRGVRYYSKALFLKETEAFRDGYIKVIDQNDHVQETE